MVGRRSTSWSGRSTPPCTDSSGPASSRERRSWRAKSAGYDGRMAVEARPTLDAHKLRADFPIFEREVNGKPLAYLDSAASAQKPRQVLDALRDFYETSYANVHRGVYKLAEDATAGYEGARGYVAKRTGAEFRAIPFDDNGELVLEALDEIAAAGNVKVVANNLVSNSLGTINPSERLGAWAHEQGAIMVVDAAQAAPHRMVDVQALGADFVAISSHKMCGPTGVGALWGRRELLEQMSPFNLGGEMIRSVKLDRTTWNELPYKFEAGTPAIAEAVGFGAAVDYLIKAGLEAIEVHEHELLSYALDRLGEIEGVTCYGPPPERRAGILSFNVDGIHPHDVAQVLDWEGIAIRAGHHCTQPLMTRLGIAATSRARCDGGRRRRRRGDEPALRGRGDDLRSVRRGLRHDRRGQVLRARLRDLAGGHVDAHRDGAGQEGVRGRGARQGRAARGDRDPAHAHPAQVRDARPDHAQGRAAQGEGHTAAAGPRRLRRPRAELVPLQGSERRLLRHEDASRCGALSRAHAFRPARSLRPGIAWCSRPEAGRHSLKEH